MPACPPASPSPCLLSYPCRQQLNETLAASSGGKLSLNDFVVKVGGWVGKRVGPCCLWMPFVPAGQAGTQ